MSAARKNHVKLIVSGSRSARKSFPSGIPLAEALAACGASVEQPCGGRGTCGKCRVRFVAEAPTPTPEEKTLLSSDTLAEGWRLSCRHSLVHNATVELPEESCAAAWKDFGVAGPLSIDCPRWKTVELSLSASTSQAVAPSVEEEIRARCSADFSPQAVFSLRAYEQLAHLLGSGEVEIEALIRDSCEVVSFLRSSSLPRLGVAVDLGTTTLAAALINLLDGSVIGSLSDLNQQVRFGADVITRIAHSNRQGIGRLREVLIRQLNILITRLCRANGFTTDQLCAGAFVGNSFMLHSFFGIAPQSLGQAPYRPVWRGPVVADGAQLGLSVLERVLIFVPPILASHVGADAAAAIVATDLDQGDIPRLLIDLGTNCEVILSFNGRLFVTSAAAGPAFEGGNLSCGMRAARGAVDRVALTADQELWVHTIGDASPQGICGAGLVHLVDLLLSSGIVDESGRLLRREGLRPEVAQLPLAQRIGEAEGGETAFLVAQGPRGENVVLTATDVRQLQLVKGSIRAAVEILLQEAALTPERLEKVFITGLLGSHLKKSSLLRIGLLPAIKPGKIQMLGNAAGFGCRLALVDRTAWNRVCALPPRVRHIELADHPLYTELFARAMMFSQF